MINHSNWQPSPEWMAISTIDAHTAGEPLRIITGGLPEIPGQTILQKRRFFRENLDHIRTGLIFEPRGHADMYAAVLTQAVTPDGDFGVFFLHNEGYSTMCGHAMIALATVLPDTGMIQKEGDGLLLNIDTPAGRVRARCFREGGRVIRVAFQNVPSFVLFRDRRIDVPGIGPLSVDVAYGGAFYAFCRSEDLGVKLVPAQYHKLIELGRAVKTAVMDQCEIHHPFETDLSFLYGTIIVGPPENPGHHSRNVCIFAEGEVDRSPTGTGVSARAALHHLRGELLPGKTIVIESILGTCFDLRVAEVTTFGEYPAVIPEVGGNAFITGRHQFLFDPNDPLNRGFIFR